MVTTLQMLLELRAFQSHRFMKLFELPEKSSPMKDWAGGVWGLLGKLLQALGTITLWTRA